MARNFFVSYKWSRGREEGFGNITIEIDYGFIDYRSIEVAQDKIKEEGNFDNVLILFIREYDEVVQ